MILIKRLFLKIVSQPLLHFILLGGLLFVLQPIFRQPLPLVPIQISSSAQLGLYENWTRETGRKPSVEEQAALLEQHIDEELLLREARRLELHLHDSVVQERLLRNMQFAEQAPGLDDATLLKSAYALGMAEADLVVRRRLLQLMRHRLQRSARVSEADALQYFETRIGDFEQPTRYSFSQVYIPSAPDADSQLLTAENALKLGQDYTELGKPFLLGKHFEKLTAAQIKRQLGDDFVPLIASAPQGEWFGPITSIYGKHLIRVDAVEAPRAPSFSTVRSRVTAELYAQREDAALRANLDLLRNRYPVHVEASNTGKAS